LIIDLHAHTWPGSWDSVLKPGDYIQRSKDAGLDGVCLTEHDYTWSIAKVQELAVEYNFLVIPGIEISTDDGHMLAWGIDEYLFGMHHSSRLAEHVRKNEGAMVAAHPYRRQMPWRVQGTKDYGDAVRKAVNNPAYAYVDAIEELNGRGNDRENAFSRAVNELLGKPATGSTDAHTPGDIAKAATWFDRDVHDVRDLIRELKAGRCQPAHRNEAGVWVPYVPPPPLEPGPTRV